MTTPSTTHFQKRALSDMAHVIEHRFQGDKPTLDTFLALVNVGGTFGSISRTEVATRLRQLRQYSLKANHHTLDMLQDLLGLNETSTENPAKTEPTPHLNGDHHNDA